MEHEDPCSLQAVSVIDLRNEEKDEGKNLFSKTGETSYEAKKFIKILMNLFQMKNVIESFLDFF